MGIKQQGGDFDHSPLSGAKVQNELSYAFTSPYTFMVWTGTLPAFCFTVTAWEVNQY
jgi:hypothetical protein